MNYGELKSLLTNYLHRTDVEAMIPNFIVLAQARLKLDLKHINMNVSTTISVTAGDPSITLPTGFLNFSRVRATYGGTTYSLDQQTLEQNANVLQGAGGPPKFYAVINMTQGEVAPAPTEDTTLSCIYRKGVATFTADSDTDAILTDYPNAYVYAAMIEATPYIRLDKRQPLWTDMYRSFVASLNDASQDAMWSDSPKQIKSPEAYSRP